jgi:hypothetical protein
MLLTDSLHGAEFFLEAERFSACEEIPRTLSNPNIYYHIYKYLPPVPILRQFDPVHTTTYYFLNIQLNIILPSTTGSPKWYLSLRFPHQNPVYASPQRHTCYMPRPSHYFLFDHPKNVG